MYILIILLISYMYQKQRQKTNEIYRYFTRGIFLKMMGAVSLCLIYTLYYGEGDTTNFFYHGGDILLNVFKRSPSDFFSIVFGERDSQHWNLFDQNTGWPYYYKDANSFFVVRIVSLCALFTFGSYIATALLLTWICYSGVWRLYKVFADLYPQYSRQLAIAVLFLPSVMFWGSGILKDSITFSAAGWYVYSFYKLFIKRENVGRNTVTLLISIYILLNVKAYIFYALMPGSLVWLSGFITNSLRNPFLRFIFSPVLLISFLGLGYIILTQLGAKQGRFSVDTLLQRAVITQQDLKRSEQYGANFYDIGNFDASFASTLAKTPLAVFSALFRPLIWEVRNPFMMVSAIENIYFFWLLFQLFSKSKWKKIRGVIGRNPLIMFSLTFTLFFSFSVGLTSTNFGALVRYRIPALPFFVASLFLCTYLSREEPLTDKKKT